MAFLGWLKKNKENDVKVSERKQNTLQDAAVAATYAEAGEHDAAREIINTKKRGHNTILIIGREETFSEHLIAYAIDMAQRLDYELMAVNITDTPLFLAGSEREQAIAEFEKNCVTNCALFNKKAAKNEIPLYHLMLVGQQDEMIDKIHSLYPGLRYVLTEPDPEAVKKAKDSIAIPVFDLGSYQGASA